MRDLVTPFATTLRRLETEDAVLIPEARIREAYRDTKIGRSVRDALARQLPVSVPREDVLFMRVPATCSWSTRRTPRRSNTSSQKF